MIRTGGRRFSLAAPRGFGDSAGMRLWPTPVILAILCFLASANSLLNGFVFDDIDNILRNPWVLQTGHLHNAFTHHMAAFRPGFDTSYYRPVMHVIFALCHQVFGLRAWGYHLTVLLVHVLATVAVYLLARDWIPDRVVEVGPRRWPHEMVAPAFVAALIFAVHPVHVEAVAWNSGVVESSWGMFFLLALLVATRCDMPIRSRVMWSSLLFLGALLSKEPAVALLLVAPVALVPRGNLRDPLEPRRAKAVIVGLVVTFLVYLVLRVNALGGLMGTGGAHRIAVGFTDALATALRLLAEYMALLTFPAHLSAVHEGHVVGFGDSLALLGLVTLVGFMCAAWWARRRTAVLVALSLLIVPLLPALYVPVLGEGLLAERYLYVPSAGAALLIGLGLANLRRRTSQGWRWATAGCGGLVVVLTLSTLRRNAVWKSDLALWIDAAAKAPSSAAAHEYLGFAYLAGGDPSNAIVSLGRALAIDPARQDARTNLASAFLSTGRVDEAASQAEEALRGPHRRPEALAIVGFARAEQGRFDEAISALKQSLELDPNQPAVHNSLGAIYVATGNSGLAGRHFARAVSLDPRNPQYARNLAQFPSSNEAPVAEVPR